MLSRALVAISSVVVLHGCWDSGSTPDEIDPLKLSAYLFSGEPDKILDTQDPDDPGRDLTWELRSILRIQSFLARSCTRGANPSCEYRLIGAVEYHLNGSLDVLVSMPSRTTSGIRYNGGHSESPMARLEAHAPDSCWVRFGPDGPYIPGDLCDPDELVTLVSLFGSLPIIKAPEPTFAEDEGFQTYVCESFVNVATLCLINPAETCLSSLPEMIDYMRAWCPSIVNYPELLDKIERQILYLRDGKDSLCDDRVEMVGCGDTVQIKTGDTTGGENRYREHGCTPDWTHDGPEKVYSLFSTSSGSLEVKFPDDTLPDIDLDIYIYKNGCDPKSCMGGGLNHVHHPIEEGNFYYLIVDGHQNASGEFKLEIQCPNPDNDLIHAEQPVLYGKLMWDGSAPAFGMQVSLIHNIENGFKVGAHNETWFNAASFSDQSGFFAIYGEAIDGHALLVIQSARAVLKVVDLSDLPADKSLGTIVIGHRAPASTPPDDTETVPALSGRVLADGDGGAVYQQVSLIRDVQDGFTVGAFNDSSWYDDETFTDPEGYFYFWGETIVDHAVVIIQSKSRLLKVVDIPGLPIGTEPTRGIYLGDIVLH